MNRSQHSTNNMTTVHEPSSMSAKEHIPSSMSVRTQEESLSLGPYTSSLLTKEIRHTHTVQFESVHIRDYPVVIGDSPSTSKGPPVSLGWEYEPATSLSMDEYESTRIEGGECERRDKVQLRLPSTVREEMLGSAGFSKHEIRQGVKQLLSDKQERRLSMRNYSRQRNKNPLQRGTSAIFSRFSKMGASALDISMH